MARTLQNSSLRQRLFTKIMVGADEDSFDMYKERKSKLLSPLRGKIVELAVRKIVHSEPVLNREALANPEALDLFADLLELTD